MGWPWLPVAPPYLAGLPLVPLLSITPCRLPMHALCLARPAALSLLSHRPCCAPAPTTGWRSTWWRQRHSSQRFNGKHRFWVQEACPPEDYLYENLGVGSTNRFLRCTCLRVLVLVVLLACALAVTALMSVNTQFQHTIAWLTGGLEEGLTAAMAATPGGGGGDSTVVAVVGSEATTAYCTEQLAGHCQGMLSE